MTVYDFIFNIIGAFGIAGLFSFVFFWILKFMLEKSVEAKIDIIKTKEIESFKKELWSELQGTQHKLELETARKAIVFDRQKESFTIIINELNEAMQKIQNKIITDKTPFERKFVEKFNNTIASQSLFINSDCDRMITLFIGAMNGYSYGRTLFQPERGDELFLTYAEMRFLSNRIREYFREQVGIDVKTHPIRDVDLYCACLFLDSLEIEKTNYIYMDIAEEKILKSPEQIVEFAYENIGHVIEALKQVVDHFNDEPETSGLSMYKYNRNQAECYLKQIKKANIDFETQNT